MYTTARINEARLKQVATENIDAVGKESMSSRIWHERYSLPYYPEVGNVGCRTTSKIMGIGPGERAWGDVKHLSQTSACASVEKN